MKKCTKCKATKNISMFYRNKYRTDGRQSHCKVCHNTVTMTWRKANPDKYSKYKCSPKNNEKMKIKSIMRSRKHRHDMSNDIRGVLKSVVNQDGRYSTKEAGVIGKLYGAELTKAKLLLEVHKHNTKVSGTTVNNNILSLS